MSLIDYYDIVDYGHNMFAPILNVESINLFDHALIASKAANYKSDDITINDLDLFYRSWLEVTGFRIKYLRELDNKGKGSNRQTLTMISTQLRYQSYFLFNRLSRTYGLLISIPKEYGSSLRQKDASFIDISVEFEAHYGISILDFLRVGIYIESLYFYIFESFLPKQKRKSIGEYFANLPPNHRDLDHMWDKLPVFMDIYEKVRDKISFFFKIGNFNDGFVSSEKISRYLELTSMSFKGLKSIRDDNQAYEKGIILDRLNPLERFPIVKSYKERFIVPNFRYFEIALTEMLHYMMQEIYPDNSYNQTRGYVQEIYIKRLISDCYDPNFIISETRYKKAKGHVLGPDLCLCDGKLILIESKAKRLTATSRADPTQLEFIQDIRAVIDALVKMIEKVRDLYSALPEYSDYYKLIESTKQYTPIVLIVMGEAIPLLPEIFQDHVIRNNIKQLNNYPYPYLILDLNLLEKILVIVYSTGQPLYDILQKYSFGADIKEIRGIQGEIDDEFRNLNPRINLPVLDEWNGKILDVLRDIQDSKE
jgi:hypothetical protein